MKERLQKIIAAAGICSRRAAEELLRQGRVRVNGQPAALGDQADPESDTVTVDGQPLRRDTRRVYLMLNKPRGYVTTLSDERGRRTAAELVRLIGSPRLKVLYDIYHMQLNEGRLCDTIRQYADTFGHVHAADAPGRREPGTGEIAFPRVYKALEAAGYTGLVGYELFPARSTREAVKAILDAG